MKILVLNCGSSSIKYKLYEGDDEIASGLLEKVGTKEAQLNHQITGREKLVEIHEVLRHKDGVDLILKTLQDNEKGVIKNIKEIKAVGHRVVHGGETFSGSVLITDEVIKKMEECSDLAPLHNPPNLAGIYAITNLLPETPQIGVFDTAFHQTMPEVSYIYALPYEYYKKYHIRRYGFHGTSHFYVANEAAKIYGRPVEELNIITCHLGNGASITAIREGKSVDTSMGFTPLEGLVMGTRSGDIDPAISFFIMEKEDLNLKQINDLLNKKSGMLGMSGISNDLRNIEEKAKEKDHRAELTLNIFSYRLKKYIGAYIAALNGVDIIVFTGGIGENSPLIRRKTLSDLEWLGIEIDEAKNNNKKRGETADISGKGSKVKIYVIPTNEELVIARDSRRIAQELNNE